jgi:hypothetical protein
MNTARRIAWPAYLVSATIIAAPFADAFTTLYPWHPGDARWRFGAVGVLTNAATLPMVGLLTALVVAVAADHRVFRRVLSVVGFAGAALAALLVAVFCLDALQTQSAVRPEMRLSFAVAAATAGAKLLLASATLLAMGLAARHKSNEATDANAKRPGSEPILWSSEPRAPARK